MKQCGFRSVVFVFADRCALSAGTGDHWLKTKSGQIIGSESRRVEPMM